jgi:hypoxanthine phosphoribosyltransferase
MLTVERDPSRDVGREMGEDVAKVLLTAEQIAARVAEMGAQISRDYEGKDLMLVCILKGANIFLADLCRHITIPLCYDFVAVSSYGADTKSSGVVRILKDLDESVESKHILVIEDIVDTGLTLRLSYLLENLRSRRAASVKICTLLDKPARRRVEVPVDYSGFTIEDQFVIGYGLDYAGKYRNLPYVGVLKPEVYGGG